MEDGKGAGNVGGAVRVLLADDHALFREGLARVLASRGGMETVAGVPNDGGAVELARELRPDAVVMEVRLPLERAKEALGEVLSLPDPPKVVVATASESPRHARELIGAGASAYLPKSAPTEHLIAAIRAAVVGPGGGNVVVGMPRETLEGREESPLSARELEVVLLAARGLSNRRIAETLHLSDATVKRHLANVYPKMGVGSRGEAVREALNRGWITVGELDAEEDGGWGGRGTGPRAGPRPRSPAHAPAAGP